MIFGASQDVSGLSTTPAQRQLTRLMQRAWASFADDPACGLKKIVHWPAINFQGETLLQLGLKNSPEAAFVAPAQYDAPCSTVTLGALATGTGS